VARPLWSRFRAVVIPPHAITVRAGTDNSGLPETPVDKGIPESAPRPETPEVEHAFPVRFGVEHGEIRRFGAAAAGRVVRLDAAVERLDVGDVRVAEHGEQGGPADALAPARRVDHVGETHRPAGVHAAEHGPAGVFAEICRPTVVDVATDVGNRHARDVGGDPAVGPQSGHASELLAGALLDQAHLTVDPVPAAEPEANLGMIEPALDQP